MVPMSPGYERGWVAGEGCPELTTGLRPWPLSWRPAQLYLARSRGWVALICHVWWYRRSGGHSS